MVHIKKKKSLLKENVLFLKMQSDIISYLEGLKAKRGTLGKMRRKEAPWWDVNWCRQDRKPHEIKNSTI